MRGFPINTHRFYRVGLLKKAAFIQKTPLGKI
jgi:hypothetical protein